MGNVAKNMPTTTHLRLEEVSAGRGTELSRSPM
jgi:hypothetical protein